MARRCPDATANPYLAFAVALTCALTGIVQKLEPPDPLDESFVTYDDAELKRRGVPRLPGTLGEALDYAATGNRGLNFHDARGTLSQPYPYSQLRTEARAIADRLIAAGVGPQDRLAPAPGPGPGVAPPFLGAAADARGPGRGPPATVRPRPRAGAADPGGGSGRPQTGKGMVGY